MPHFFAPEEASDFTDFLEREVSSTAYFVVENHDGLLGCGGVYVHEGWGGMVWGMVTRAEHLKRVGRFLLLQRLEHLYRRYPEKEALARLFFMEP